MTMRKTKISLLERSKEKEKKTKQACPKVLKVGGAIALEPAKSWGAKHRAMYLNLEIWGGL